MWAGRGAAETSGARLVHRASDLPPARADRRSAGLNAPIVLVGTLPEPGRLESALNWDLLLIDPRIDHLADGAAILRAGVPAPALPGETSGPADRQPRRRTPRLSASVEIRASLLLRSAVGHGLQGSAGARDRSSCLTRVSHLVPRVRVSSGRRPGLAWAAVVPELPSWARTMDAFGPTPADTFALWQALAPVPSSPTAAEALRVRACLAHQLFALTGFSPALGWAALITGTNNPVEVVTAAHNAGIRILPPSVQSGSAMWENDVDASVPSLRAPLGILEEIASTADDIGRSVRLDGPFASVPDLVRRVPAIAASPDTLRGLLEVGALDSLCDRELLLTHWSVVSEWCKNPTDSTNPELLAAGVPLFAIPSDVAVDAQETGGWWDRFVMDRATSDAPEAVSVTPVDGGAALKEAVPSERRIWRKDGEDLIVLALQGGERSVHCVLTPVKDGGATPRSIVVQTAKPSGDGAPAVWIDAALVSPPVGQVEVSVPLLGDRDRDLERIRRVKAILGRYTGDIQVRLALIHGDSRRDLPPAADDKVVWSGELVDDLEVLLGPNSVRLATSG